MAKVIVVGSINMDVVATADRRPRVGETVMGRNLGFFPGGKGANQAVSTARLGVPTVMVGKLGTDRFGDELYAFLSGQGVDVSHVGRTSVAPTGTAVIVVDGHGDNSIVVVSGANGLLGPSDLEGVDIEADDVLVSQFEVPLEAVGAAFSLGRTVGATTVLNPAPATPAGERLLSLVDVLVLNQLELAALSSEEPAAERDVDAIAAAATRLCVHPNQVVIVTLGAQGAVAVEGDQRLIVTGHRVNAVDTTGAGDCFVGGLATQLALGHELVDAVRFANAAAAICVQRHGAGTSMPTAEEVRRNFPVEAA
ncbi:MAG: rbsK [Chloroflexi bacterium]|nr:rbsK [Chloroflexota bacterium]